MGQLHHLQIQQVEKQHRLAIKCPKHADSTQDINYTKNEDKFKNKGLSG